MDKTLLTVSIRSEPDVVLTRQRARQLARLLGFDVHEQTRIATAVSEIARNAFRYAGGGKVAYVIEEGHPQMLAIRVDDHGPGIRELQTVLDGQYRSTTGLGLGISGAQRLMDDFQIDSWPGKGTTVVLRKELPRNASPVAAATLSRLAEELARETPEPPTQELLQQNQELLRALNILQQRQSEIERLNRELEETNRGVLALYGELDDKADALRRVSELKSRFLSNMTHELRTPLNSILMLSRLLLDGMEGDLTEYQHKSVSYINNSATSLLELVNDLLDLAKIEAGKLVVRPTPFEVGALFGALRAVFRPLVSKRSVELIFDEPMHLPAMHTDEGKVSQVLRNLISNALKFTERGQVRVRAELQSPGVIVFEVADTGIGIAPEDQERIFQEYEQLQAAQNTDLKGTGLGLSLSRRLVELLGGKLYLSSQLGIGSHFFAAVPAVYSESPPSPGEDGEIRIPADGSITQERSP